MDTADELTTPSWNLTATTTTPGPIDEGDRPEFTECFLRREGEMSALDRAQLVPLNLDVRATVATALGVPARLEPYRSQLAALPFVDHARIAALEDYAGALWHAHARFLGTVPPAETVTPLYQEGFALRATLLADLTAITRRGLVSPHALDRFENLPGYMNVAAELTGLAEALTEVWPKIDGKTLIRPEEIARARELGEQLVRLFAVRRRGATAEASETRQRAFTLVVRAYEEARRALYFLRWYEQDADVIAPSLYAGRRGGGRKTKRGRGSSASEGTESELDASANVTEPEGPAARGGTAGPPLTH